MVCIVIVILCIYASVTYSDEGVTGLRYLTLGASTTWGSALEDRYTAYPYQLSPNVSNLAIRACGSNYPSICTQSMVGNDNIYDVIILEYLNSEDGIDVLVKRLRQRFPDAVIIMLLLWTPSDLDMIRNDGVKYYWRGYYESLGYKIPITQDQIRNISLETSYYEYKYIVYMHLNKDHQILKSVNGHPIGFGAKDGKAHIENVLSHYADMVHLNQRGHNAIANMIKSLLKSLKP